MTALPTIAPKPRTVHIKEAQLILDRAREHGQTVRIRAWEGQTGNALLYDGWLVSSSNWRGGWHRLVSPTSHEIRTIPDIFIFEINGLGVYL